MTEDKYVDIRDHVSHRYAERARQASGLQVVSSAQPPCCSDEATISSMDKSLGALPDIYLQEDLSGIPFESIVASAGCGNPTALAGLKEGERVLDLGSGGGIDCFLAARQVGDTGHVIGVDMTSDMLSLARRNAENLGIVNVEFLKGHIEDVPLPNCSVDVVISNCVVCLSPDKDAVARECFRVLTPGGRLHISDIMALGPVPQVMREDSQQWASCVSGAEERKEYMRHLLSAGFVDIEIIQDGHPIPQDNEMPDIVSVNVVAHKY